MSDLCLLNSVWHQEEVQLIQMLDAREYRAYKQRDLLKKYNLPLLCFTMNIAGPVKKNVLVVKGFRRGMRDFRLQAVRYGMKIVHSEVMENVTGCEAYFVMDGDPAVLKNMVCELEDRDEAGRLYDMDVLYPDAEGNACKMDRQDIGREGRTCLICGRPAKECSSRRIHSVADLQKKTADILLKQIRKEKADRIAEYAVRALLYEVCVTPKPGLVDRNNSGSHRDMDIYTFMSSSAALYPYFRQCAAIGMDTADLEPVQVFSLIREEGKKAEAEMFRASHGVNTHKGAVFTIGILAAASGRNLMRSMMDQTDDENDADVILGMCAQMTAGLTEKDFAGITMQNAVTAGQKLYAEYGITGVRGQMESGLPAVKEYGLPLLKKMLAEGKSRDEAGRCVLLKMIACTQDTNLIHRGNMERQKAEAEYADRLLENNSCPDEKDVLEMDRRYIEDNLSPGGSADLLAACWYLYFLEQEGE